MGFFNPNEKELKMIWEVEKDNIKTYLAGSTHLFPFSFKKNLKRIIADVNTVVLEGPVDEVNMKKVIDNGFKGKGMPSLYHALDKETVIKINREIEFAFERYSPFISSVSTVGPETFDWLFAQIEGLRPWMAFFDIMTHYLRKRGWKYFMDMDAFNIARRMGKDIHFLEDIEEQIEALNGIPLAKIVKFLEKIDTRDSCIEKFVDCYTKGYFLEMTATINGFPMNCVSIIENRDPVLYKRMKPFLDKGNSIIFVGVMHIPGIQEMLLNDGYNVKMLC